MSSQVKEAWSIVHGSLQELVLKTRNTLKEKLPDPSVLFMTRWNEEEQNAYWKLLEVDWQSWVDEHELDFEEMEGLESHFYFAVGDGYIPPLDDDEDDEDYEDYGEDNQDV